MRSAYAHVRVRVSSLSNGGNFCPTEPEKRCARLGLASSPYGRNSPHMNKDAPSPSRYSRWANRFLILSLGGIVYFTLFPFRFDFSVALPGNRFPFLLGPSWKYHFFIDFFLNFLLFVPFGFGLAAESRKRNRNWATGLFLALASGCLVSYTIEFLQLYVPSRDSGWDDVFSNTLGSIGGFFLLELFGQAIFRQLSRVEDALESWVSLKRASLLLVVYFAVWFGVSIPLQQETRLSNWDEQCPLIIGNDASGERPWKGEISRLQIWSRVLAEERVRQLAGRDRAADADPDSELLAAYEFPASGRFAGKTTPAVFWQTGAPFVATSADLRLDGKSWLSTKMPITDLIDKIRRASQFTLRVTCSPALDGQAAGQIMSISRSDDETDLSLRQAGSMLGFWFRNPLSEDRASLSWYLPEVFSTPEAKDIFITYDGSDAVVYLNGQKLPQGYRLGPGTSLAHRFSFIRTVSLPGYEVLYSTFIFLPSGILIGFAAGNQAAREAHQRFILGSFLIAPPILVELLLALVGQRGISFYNPLISLLLACGGALLINADRRGTRPEILDTSRS